VDLLHLEMVMGNELVQGLEVDGGTPSPILFGNCEDRGEEALPSSLLGTAVMARRI